MTGPSCRDVAFILAEAAAPDVVYADPVAQHLSRCPKCGAFERQLVLVSEAVRDACQRFEDELPADFEMRLVQMLRA